MFDLLCEGSGVGGRTVRRRLAEWRQADVFEAVAEGLRALLPQHVPRQDDGPMPPR